MTDGAIHVEAYRMLPNGLKVAMAFVWEPKDGEAAFVARCKNVKWSVERSLEIVA